MRSIAGLAALALVGTFQVVGAARSCKHRTHHSSATTSDGAYTPSRSPTPSDTWSSTPAATDSTLLSSHTNSQPSSASPSGGDGSQQTSESTPHPSSSVQATSIDEGGSQGTSGAISPTSAASVTQDDPSGVITPSATRSTTDDFSGTPTSQLTTVTQTDGTVVVVNLVKNGNLAQSLGGYIVDGDAIHDGTSGYTGGNSGDTGCAKLQATGPTLQTSILPAKRQVSVSDTVTISQTLTGLDTTKEYTYRFYYSIVSGPSLQGDCVLMASFNDNIFASVGIQNPASSPSQYQVVLGQTIPPQVDSALRIKLWCRPGASAAVFIDSIFLSDKVTPANIQQFIIDNPGDGSIPTTSLIASTRTTSLPGLPTNACQRFGTASNGISAEEFNSFGGNRPVNNGFSRARCLQTCTYVNPQCGAVSYNEALAECRFYTGNLEQIGFQEDANSPTEFYSGSCVQGNKLDECGTMGAMVADSSNPEFMAEVSPFQPFAMVCYGMCVAQYQGCVSFGWNAATMKCQFFRATREQSGLVPGRSQWVYYEKACITP